MDDKLVFAVASSAHYNWCIEELKDYYERARKIYASIGNSDRALLEACLINGVRRNIVEFNEMFFSSHPGIINRLLESGNFDDFMDAVNGGYISVKSFIDGEVCNDKKLPNEYYYCQDNNILRDFDQLSFSFQENIKRIVKKAYRVYLDLLQREITYDDMMSKHNLQLRQNIGVFIHSQNCGELNDKVSYDELDEQTKRYNLIVFDTLVKIMMEKSKKRQLKNPTV